MYRVLVVDDDKATVALLDTVLKEWGYTATPAFDGEEAQRRFLAGSFDLVVTDIRMEPVDGVALLRMIHQKDPDIPVIMLSGFDDITAAAEAMKAGAFDYIEKPFNIQDLGATMIRALGYRQAVRGLLDFKLVVGSYHRYADIVAVSEAMKGVCAAIQRVAPSDVPVLLSGESGTGRALVARTIHETGLHRDKSFVTVDCAPPGTRTSGEWGGLLDSAEGGTVFFRDVHSLPAGGQASLVDEIWARRDLTEERRSQGKLPRFLASIAPGVALEADLLAVLGSARIEIEPLRRRKADLLPLMYHLLRRELGGARDVPHVEIEACLILERYDWPGNVAELGSMIRDMASGGRPDAIRKEALPDRIREGVGDLPPAQKPDLKREFLFGQGLERFLSGKGKQDIAHRVDSALSAPPTPPVQPTRVRHKDATHPAS